MKKAISMLLLLTMLFTLGQSAALAQSEVSCESDVVVQADDWLSKIADKFYGDSLAYPVIADATNAKAAGDSSFATIENPDLIEIGWKLCIPGAGVGWVEPVVKPNTIGPKLSGFAAGSTRPTHWTKKRAIEAQFADWNVKYIAHFSHRYVRLGVMVYDRFIIEKPPEDADEALRLHNRVWDLVVQKSIECGGLINEHHGVGLKLARYMRAQYGPAFQVLETLKYGLDANNVMNPGKMSFGPTR